MSKRTHHITIEGGSQKLHAVIEFPVDSAACAVLLLHPHPLYGGDLDNSVILKVAEVLIDAGLIVMRFNFRSAEPGTTYAGVAGAIDDALVAFDTLRKETEQNRIGVIGYSFGASVALHLAAMREVAFLVTLSASYSLASEVVTFGEHLSAIICPTLLIHGTNDHVVSPNDMGLLAAMLENADVQTVSIEGDGHFYSGHLNKAVKKITDFVNGRCSGVT